MHSTSEGFSIRGLGHARGRRELIHEFDFFMPIGARLGLVGPNGSGKSTLLAMLAGRITPDAGWIRGPDGARIEYLPQILDASDTPADSTTGADKNARSGGEERLERLRLLLDRQPELLLLDEPENDLDAFARDRVRRWLIEYPGALVIVSHRPDFLAGLVDSLLVLRPEAEGSNPLVFHGDFEAYEREEERLRRAAERRTAQARAERARLKTGLQNLAHTRSSRRRKPRDNDRSMIGIRKETASKSRTQLARLQRRIDAVEVPDEGTAPPATRFAAEGGRQRERTLLEFAGGEVPVRPDFTLDLPPLVLSDRSRILLRGRNGSGKSTLLAWLVERIRETVGERAPENAIQVAALPQRLDWPPGLRAGDWLRERIAVDDNPAYRLVRSGLRAGTLDRRCETLSAGEGLRLWFAARARIDLLLLDELTNHLDLEGRRALYELLEAFAGGWLLVSHDEDWRAELEVDREFEIEGGRLREV